ncbi:MAG: hypothetical protein M1281_14805 [Chloroflexi bacterium]|nr:hypothetical protein [Chloroflexota bacterium]
MPSKLKKSTLLKVGLGLLLVGLLLAACQSSPTTAPEAITQPTSVPVVTEPTQAPPAPTAVPPTATTPPEPSPTPIPFTASVKMLGINPGQAVMVNLPSDPTKQAALVTSGLNVVPPGVPEYVVAGAIGMAKGAKLASYEWKIARPDGSTATIAEAPADEKTKIPAGAAVFTPDKTGEYTVTLIVKDDTGNTSLPFDYRVTVATYIGADQCKTCHADQYAKWEQTPHATVFTTQVNVDPEKEYAEGGFSCARCHTVGYYPIATQATGGFWDVAVNVLKYVWPKAQIGKAGTFEAMPAELKNVANIQCENCHGPGSEHKGDPTKIGVSMDAATCDQCHNAPSHHTKGEQAANSVHATAGSLTPPNGRSECASCHSPQGFVDFLNGVPADQMNTAVGNLDCATCHDPHGSSNFASLRVVGTPQGIPVDVKDAGLSAICMECHNSRTTPDTVDTDNPSYPHYSSSADAIAGTGGYTFGVTIPDSPHGKIIGTAPVKDANGNELYDGTNPGSCVTCHMATTPGGDLDTATVDGKTVPVTDPGHNLVGSHTFNMTSEDGTVENVAACQSCHAGITSFNFAAKADYDGNGKVEGVQDEVKGLLADVKEALIAQGVEVIDGHPYFTLPDNPSTAIKGAVYNYRLIMGVIPTGEGRGWAAHNFERAVALLQISYFELAGKDVPNATILYTK